MSLTIPEAVSFVPKTISLVEKGVSTVKAIKNLPVKSAKTVAATLGVVEGSFLHDFIDLIDDVIAAAKD
jgi:hypothetical protein